MKGRVTIGLIVMLGIVATAAAATSAQVDELIVVNVSDWLEEAPVYNISKQLPVTATIVKLGPKMSVYPKEFKTDIYQGSNATFGIVIEETSGLAPLENVRLYLSPFIACIQESCPKVIPEEWISFDKNNFDVPAGGKVTVNCEIKIPKDAESGKYIRFISIDAENIPPKKLSDKTIIGPDEYVKLDVHVRKDIIPPEIVVYSPKDGEVVNEPYVTIKGVARDNIGIKRLEIHKRGWIRPLTIGIEKEKRGEVEVEFSKTMQLEEGWNYFTIVAEDLAGNKAPKTISVKYEPTIVTPTPIVPTTPTLLTPITSVPTPTPVLVPPNKEAVSDVKPLKVVYYVDVDRRTKELIINITLENIGEDIIRDVYVQMETPRVLQRTLVLNAVEEPDGLYIGDLSPQDSKTITQRFKLTGKVEGDLKIPVIIKASGSDLQTILVIIIVIAEALLKLLQYGVIPGFEAIAGIAAIVAALKLKRR